MARTARQLAALGVTMAVAISGGSDRSENRGRRAFQSRAMPFVELKRSGGILKSQATRTRIGSRTVPGESPALC
jgi:hypothetical protein